MTRYSRLASSIIYANAWLRAEAGVLVRNRRGQSGLWSYAISGDLPIVLLQIGDSGNIDLVRRMVQAHAYWRLKGLAVDLVIWNEDRSGYRQVRPMPSRFGRSSPAAMRESRPRE